MAELGNIFGGNASAEMQKIEVEMLDYGYVNECKDWNQLSAIVDVLKSGKEGHYPDLIRAAEERLIELLPPKEKRRYFSINHKTTPTEIAEAESELHCWEKLVLVKDETLQLSKTDLLRNSKKQIPVRGSGGGAKLSAGDDETKYGELKVADERVISLLTMLSSNQKKKFEKLQVELCVEDLTLVKRQYKAGLEKTKGNESFRIGDNQDAVTCYSKSLAYEPTSAVVWANRAMAYIRLELFDLADADSSVALLLDPVYVKAYSRRGLVRFKRGKYAEAVLDFSQALHLDPDNAELTKLLNAAKEKYREVEGTAVAVEDVNEPYEKVVEVNVPTLDTFDTFEVFVQRVPESSSLLIPPLEALLVEDGEVTRIASSANTFVRVSVVSDDESDVEEEDSWVPTTFNRVAITEEDDSSDDDDGGSEQNEDTTSKSSQDGKFAALQREQRVVDLKERGNVLMKQGNAAGAVLLYTESLTIVPDYLPSLNNRAQAYLTLKLFQLSEQDSSAVLRQEPGNVKALYRRALSLNAQHRVREALADVNNVLALDPSNALAQELFAQLTAVPLSAAPTTTLPVAAGDNIARSAPIQPSLDVQKLRQKAQQLLGDGLNDKVIALLAQYLRTVDQPPFCEMLQSDQTSLLHLLATAYSSTEDYEHAVAVHAAILLIDPTNARALYKRAEGQLQLATLANGAARISALLLAEEDIEAAISAQSGGAEALALRQKLLRLRNSSTDVLPSQHPSRVSNTHGSTGASSSRLQSDAQKDLGNRAMAEKNYATAIMHYSNAIKFDDTNLAAFNNRALAHLKMKSYVEAEADASTVIGNSEDDSQQINNAGNPDGSENLQVLKLKALCRRAQARRALGEYLFLQAGSIPTPPHSTNAHIIQSEGKFVEALHDLQRLLKIDPANKTALAELRLAKDGLKKCTDAATPLRSVNAKMTNGSDKLSSPESAKKPPRADINRVSAMFSSPAPHAKGSSTGTSPALSAFEDLGMVARSSKKFNSAANSSTVDDVQTQAASPPKAAAPIAISAKKAISSPTPSVALTSAPTDPPKTVYEFERVWRGLKGRPDLFAEYIGCFKKSTFKKVLKEAVSPDLVSFMWRALRDHAPSPQVQIKALSGFSAAPSFALTLSLLPEEDLQCVQSILTALGSHAAAEEELTTRLALQDTINFLCESYGMK